MNDTPHGRGHVHIHTQPRRKAQDFYSPPVSSAPSKTPDYPIAPEPDERAPLPAYDTKPRKSVRVIRFKLHRGTLEFKPEFWRAGRAVYRQDMAREAARRAARTTFPYLLTRAVFAAPGWDRMVRASAPKEWLRQFRLPRKPEPRRTGRFSRLDAAPTKWRLKPQHPDAELVDSFFAGGGRMAFYPTHREGKVMENRRIDLWRDGNDSWRVEMIENDVADTIAFFADFEGAQRFALAAAKLWNTEFWAGSKAA